MAETLDIVLRRHIVDIDLEVPLDPDRPVTVLFGPSGAGKTTVLRCLAGLDKPSPGSRITFGPHTWDDDEHHVPARRRHVGYLFQDHALFPHMTVTANVAFGLHRIPRRDRPQRASEALTAAGASHLHDRKVRLLSGGEGQRVALARALAPRPQLLLLDEPLSALDTPTRRRLRTELRQLLLDSAIPTLVVTHDRAEALALGDRVAILVNGRLRQFGDVEDVFSHPADPEVATAVDMETVTAGTVIDTHNGVTAVRVGSTQLFGVSDRTLAPDSAVLVCLRAENVALTLDSADRRSSPRNELPATIRSLTADGPVLRVELDAGFRFSAYITRPTCDELDLHPGQSITALVKATAVHLIPRTIAATPTPQEPQPPAELA